MAETVEGWDGFADWLKKLEGQIVSINFNLAFTEIEAVLEQAHQQRFLSKKTPTGNSWPEWFFTTPENPLHDTLEVSGKLRESLQMGGDGHISTKTENELIWGTNVKYAGIHNYGATITTGIWLMARGGKWRLPPGSTLHIPQREFMGLNEEITEDIETILLDNATAQLAGP